MTLDPKMLRLLPLVVMLLLMLAVVLGLFNGSDRQEGRLVGYRVAPFDVPALGNNAQRFSPKAWQGRVAVLNVFASGCKPCVTEHPVLMRLAQSGKVAVYGLAWKDTPEKAAAFINEQGNPYQLIGVDEGGNATIPLALTRIPETFVIAGNGNIYFDHKEPLTDDVVNTVILPLIEKLEHHDTK